jgi:hypothetical protein
MKEPVPITYCAPGVAIGAAPLWEPSARARGSSSRLDWVDAEEREYLPQSIQPEVALWRAVLLQVILDAKSNSGKRDALYHKEDAQHWLREERQAFNEICELAYLDPYLTRVKIENAAERDFRWRRSAVSRKANTSRRHT